jgi:hypothetical protein
MIVLTDTLKMSEKQTIGLFYNKIMDEPIDIKNNIFFSYKDTTLKNHI